MPEQTPKRIRSNSKRSQALRMIKDGIRPAHAARLVGVTRQAVSTWMKETPGVVSPGEWRLRRKERALEMIRQGELNKVEIALKIGTTIDTIAKWAKDNGLKAASAPRKKATSRPKHPLYEEVTQELAAGGTRFDVANKYNISYRSIRRWEAESNRAAVD